MLSRTGLSANSAQRRVSNALDKLQCSQPRFLNAHLMLTGVTWYPLVSLNSDHSRMIVGHICIWGNVLHEYLIATQLVSKFPAFVVPHSTIIENPPNFCPYPNWDENGPHSLCCLFKIHADDIFQLGVPLVCPRHVCVCHPYLSFFYDRMTLHRNRFRVNKTNRYT
jgi:hypothetical protein